MTLHVGTSGWHYADWRHAFYPDKLPQRQWLTYYARHFGTVELNNTFYRLPDATRFRSWDAQTPAGFVFTVKASRYLTHYRRLRDPQEPVARLCEAAGALGAKLGPVLLQLPPDMPADRPRLEDTLLAFGRRVRLACEFRHPSWYSDDVYTLLREHDAALCLTDRKNRHNELVRTASWGFLRMHEGTATPPPHYGARAIEAWVDRLGELWGERADCFVYFNNDHGACAVRDATTFVTTASRAGFEMHDPAPDRTRPSASGNQ